MDLKCLARLALAALLATTTAASAQTATFNKPVSIYIGYTPGGSYDLYARIAARHLGRFLPGKPSVVPQNMPGAGSLNAANFLYNVAPKDGTALGAFVETLTLEEILDNPGVHYSASRFAWIGRQASSINVQLVSKNARVQSFQDALTQEAVMAGSPGAVGEFVPKLLNALAGTRFKIIAGYPASAEGLLALERGEVDGVTTSWAALKATRADWLRDGKIKVILQDLPKRSPELSDVPALVEFGRNPEDRQVLALYAGGGVLGRYLVAPPGTPPAIVKALRESFDAMSVDPQYLLDLQAATLDSDPMLGAELQSAIGESMRVSDDVKARAKQVLAR